MKIKFDATTKELAILEEALILARDIYASSNEEVYLKHIKDRIEILDDYIQFLKDKRDLAYKEQNKGQ
jgi:hypothetical protein